MVHSSCQVLNGAFAKFIHSEDVVVNVGDAIDVVFKHINAEGVMEFYGETEKTSYGNFCDSIYADLHNLALSTHIVLTDKD